MSRCLCLSVYPNTCACVCVVIYSSCSSVFLHLWFTVLGLVIQSCLTLCNPMDYSPPGSSVHGDSSGKNTREGCHALFQGIFPTQGLNLGLAHCRWILYHLSHQGSPMVCYISLILENP